MTEETNPTIDGTSITFKPKTYVCPEHGPISNEVVSVSLSTPRSKHLNGAFCLACILQALDRMGAQRCTED